MKNQYHLFVSDKKDKTDTTKVRATEWNNPHKEQIPEALSELTEDVTHRVTTDAEKSTWNGKANSGDIPTALNQLSDDITHRVVTDTEKSTWNGKQDALTNPVMGNGTVGKISKFSSASVITDAVAGTDYLAPNDYQSYSPGVGTTVTLDISAYKKHRIQMPAGNITIALSNVVDGCVFSISITQDGGGSRLITWFSTIRWAGGVAPVLTTTGSKRDTFIFIATGAAIFDGYMAGFNL